jgi:hypothetical protein
MSSNPEPGNSSKSPKTRKTASVSEGMDRRLGAYALLACASGVSLAALNAHAPEVYASGPSMTALAQRTPASTIIYTATNIGFAGSKRSNTPPIPIDMNKDGVADFTITAGGSGSATFSQGFSHYNGTAVVRGAAAGNSRIYHALNEGAHIGPDQKFVERSMLIQAKMSHENRSTGGRSQCLGPFKGASNSEYLGVKFLIEGKTHYGWIRLTASCESEEAPGRIQGTITGYAYEALPDTPIPAGQTSNGGSEKQDTEKPAALGALGLGSAGLPLWRK